MREIPAIYSFGEWLRRTRQRLDLTQETLAHRTGCAAITIRKIESDERRPSRQMAARLALALAIPEEERAGFVAIALGEQSLLAAAGFAYQDGAAQGGSLRPGRQRQRAEAWLRLAQSHPSCPARHIAEVEEMRRRLALPEISEAPVQAASIEELDAALEAVVLELL